MKTIQDWFDAYAVSHQNKTNKFIHFVCVPAIFFSIVGLFTSIPSAFIANYFSSSISNFVNFGSIFVLIGVLFYLKLSRPMFIGMLIVGLLCVSGNVWISNHSSLPLWMVSAIIFVVAWIGQFIGHHIEGEKPSFIDDLKFLMIGPAWILGFIYKKIGLKY